MTRSLDDILRHAPLHARLGLGVTFLTSVSDRFGVWGRPGATDVALGGLRALPRVHGRSQPLPPSRRHSSAWLDGTAAETGFRTVGCALPDEPG